MPFALRCSGSPNSCLRRAKMPNRINRDTTMSGLGLIVDLFAGDGTSI